MSRYDAMTTADFDRLLAAHLDETYTAPSQLLAVAGVYELLAEECNNAVLEAWDAERELEQAEVDDWDAPACLRWLAAHTSGPNHFAERAETWPDEVARFAAHEDTDPDEWNDTATEELRAAVRAAWTTGGGR